MDQSVISEDGDEEAGEGLGAGFSLPAFLADFIQGVTDRFCATIKDIQMEVILRLSSTSPGNASVYAANPEDITVCLNVSSIHIQEVSAASIQAEASEIPDSFKTQIKDHAGSIGRQIALEGLQLSLLSTSALSSFMSQLSTPSPPSPATTHASTSSRRTNKSNPPALPDETSNVSSGLGMLHTDLKSTGRHKPDDPGSPTASNFNRYPDSEADSQFLESSARSSQSQAESDWMDSRYRDFDQSRNSLLDEIENNTPIGLNDGSQVLSASDAFHFARKGQGNAASSSTRGDTAHPPDERMDAVPHAASLLSATDDEDFSKPSLPNVDNAKSAQLFHEAQEGPGGGFPTSSSGVSSPENLAESRVFTHKEAESMYLSALSQGRSKNIEPGTIPGGWASDESEQAESPETTTDVFHDLSSPPEQHPSQSSELPTANSSPASTKVETKEQASSELDDDDSPPRSLYVSEYLEDPPRDTSTPTPPKITTKPGLETTKDTPASSPPKLDTLPTAKTTTATVKPFFFIDHIDVHVPRPESEVSHSIDLEEKSSERSELPGAFSTYQSTLASSVPQEMLLGSQNSRIQPTKPNTDEKAKSFHVHIQNSVFLTDIAFVRLLIVMSQHLSMLGAAEPRKDTKADTLDRETSRPPEILVQTNRLSIKFVDALKSHTIPASQSTDQKLKALLPLVSETLLQLEIESLSLSSQHSTDSAKFELMTGKFIFGFPNEPIISFDSTLKMRESVRDALAPTDQDLTLKIKQSIKAPTEVELMTAPIHLKLNLARLEDAINWLGGLSSVLDLGNSVMSTVTVVEPKPRDAPMSKPRGVHFEAHQLSKNSESGDDSNHTKVYIRFGGLAVDLHGKSSSLSLIGTAVKVVARSDAVRMQVDRLKLYGPVLKTSSAGPAVTTQLETFKLEYSSVPKEHDLGRLLALLSPSQDRDAPDDDILLDTLLRQRRKGGLLRLTVSSWTGDVSKVHELNHFQTIAEEMSQLSTVTKYLPEDDRPGLLVLSLIEKVNINVEINPKLGAATLISKNLELGFVTLPSLFLLGIDLLQVKHQDIELIGEASPRLRRGLSNKASTREEQPTIMVKLIGEEMEPALKIKLHNLRVEYHVSTIMAAMGISETASGEVIVAEMVNSVANLKAPPISPKSPASSTSTSNSKRPFKVDVKIQDCTVGLNPKGASAKGLVVLTKSRFLVTPPSSTIADLDAQIELAKVSLMLVDDTKNLIKSEDVNDPNILSGLGNKPNQLQCLSAIGYVAVGDISSAKIIARTTKSEDAETHLDVEIHDDLFVLETCADSTQTLLAVLGGLSPPTPPSKGLKYRTEVMPIENMLASFSGDAFPADPRSEDDTDYSADDDDHGTVALDEDNDDELPPDFGLEESFYDQEIRSVTQSVDNSMLGADLSTLGGLPAASAISDKPIVESFQERYETSESLHFDENHFGKKTNIGGRAHRWNSEKNTYDLSTDFRIRGSPLRLRLRDAHFIWNLFDGYDWQRTRDAISQAVDEIEAKAAEKIAARREKRKTLEEEDDEESVIGDFLFNSIYIGISANQDPRDLPRRINGDLHDAASETGSYATTTTVTASPSRRGSTTVRKKRLRLQRSKHHKLTFELSGVSADVIVFPPDSGETQSSIDIRVNDLDIFDHVPTSTWKKFATYMHDAGERESGSSMVHIEALTVRPDVDLLASEIVLKASVLPLRLHVDQDALDFMTRFFEFKDTPATTPTSSTTSRSPTADPQQPFIQRAEIGPIRISLDFKPKRVDYAGLRSGHTTEFMHFFVLDGADMVLRRTILYGVRGFEKLGRSLNDIWMPDVRRNQLPGILAGLAPVRSLVNVGAGVRDLVVVPMREYKKDGRLVRAVQKGAVAFAKSTSTELVKLGAKLAVGTHNILSGAEGLLAPPDDPSSSSPSDPTATDHSDSAGEERPKISPYADQPVTVVQGLRGAYRHLERDLLLAKDAIVAMPGEVMEARSAGGAARAVLRGAPTVVLRPAMGVSSAVAQTMMGATNALDGGERRRVEEVSDALFFFFFWLRRGVVEVFLS